MSQLNKTKINSGIKHCLAYLEQFVTPEGFHAVDPSIVTSSRVLTAGIDDTTDFLLKNQFSQGYWGNSPSDHHRYLSTLEAVSALHFQKKKSEKINQAIEKGQEYLDNALEKLSKETHLSATIVSLDNARLMAEYCGLDFDNDKLKTFISNMKLNLKEKPKIPKEIFDMLGIGLGGKLRLAWKKYVLGKYPILDLFDEITKLPPGDHILSTGVYERLAIKDVIKNKKQIKDNSKLKSQIKKNYDQSLILDIITFYELFKHNIKIKNELKSLILNSKYKEGGYPCFFPFTVWNNAFCLYHFNLANLKFKYEPQLIAYLEKIAKRQSFGWNNITNIADGDSFSLTLNTLKKYGNKKILEKKRNYIFSLLNSKGGFKSFSKDDFRSSPSVTAHILGILDEKKDKDVIEDCIQYFKSIQENDGSFIDQWHLSQIYISSHILIETQKFQCDELCDKIATYLYLNQNNDGSFGYGTIEETGYAIMALYLLDGISDTIIDGTNNIIENIEKKRWGKDLWTVKDCYSTPVLRITPACAALHLIKEKSHL